MAYPLDYANLRSHYLGTTEVLCTQSHSRTCSQTPAQINRVCEVLLFAIRLCDDQLCTPWQINDLVDERMYEIMNEAAAFVPIPADEVAAAGRSPVTARRLSDADPELSAVPTAGLAALRLSAADYVDELAVPRTMPWPGNSPVAERHASCGGESDRLFRPMLWVAKDASSDNVQAGRDRDAVPFSPTTSVKAQRISASEMVGNKTSDSSVAVSRWRPDGSEDGHKATDEVPSSPPRGSTAHLDVLSRLEMEKFVEAEENVGMKWVKLDNKSTTQEHGLAENASRTFVFKELLYKHDAPRVQRYFRYTVGHTLEELVNASRSGEVKEVADAYWAWVEKQVPEPREEYE
jgi:hypothetical protein